MDVIRYIPTAPMMVNEKLVSEEADPVSPLCIFRRIAVAKGLEIADIIMMGAKHIAKAMGALCPIRNMRAPKKVQMAKIPKDTRYELAFRILM